MSTYNGYYAQTDESGTYTLGGVAAEDYQICFDPTYAQGPAAGGYAAQCYDNQPSVLTANPVTVGTAGTVTVNAVLSSGAAITGQVTGSDGAPLGGVYVDAYSPESGQQVSATSDYPDGSYRLPGLSEGDYIVCFNAVNVREPATTGYINECYDGQGGSFYGTPVHVGAGEVTSGIDAVLAVGAEITGRVTDSAGNPVLYAYIDTYGADGSYLGAYGSTDDSGRYELAGLPATAVVVCFQSWEGGANGTGYLPECYDNQPDVSTATPVNTSAGQVSRGIDAVLADAPPAG
jgi:protocatechuate 3,4-dioxygenase beta subunit